MQSLDVWIKSSKGGAHENSQAAPRCAKCAAQHLEFECLKDGREDIQKAPQFTTLFEIKCRIHGNPGNPSMLSFYPSRLTLLRWHTGPAPLPEV